MKRVHLVTGTSKVLDMYPTTTKEIGSMGRYNPGGLPPSTSMTNCNSVYQTAKTFGQKNRDNVHVLSRPVMPKKR